MFRILLAAFAERPCATRAAGGGPDASRISLAGANRPSFGRSAAHRAPRARQL